MIVKINEYIDMAVPTNIPLKIVNASAGSGKTYTLVMEYLLLLLAEEHDLTRFSRIIAMTFTNKAALEMKTRIIQALDDLSYPEIYGEKSNAYAKKLAETLVVSTDEVHRRARAVLQNILHRYEEFHVMTIDKFNLKLIRSFSRDLNLPTDFEVILNESEIIEQVVDLLLDQLGKEALPKLTTLVFEYAKQNLDDGEKWDFRQVLVEFGAILSKERDQPLIEKLMGFDFSIERYTLLKETFFAQKVAFVARAQDTLGIYHNLGLTADQLPGKSTTARAIEKLGDLTEIPAILFTPAFLKKCTEIPANGRTMPTQLTEALLALHNYHLHEAPSYHLNKLYLKNFYTMAMLQYMSGSLEIIKKDQQLIRISEFNKLISDLVRNEEAPFIYERLGERFQHFLLDEFQDTSRLQWLNMVPLIHHSISQEKKNLIVGDPKQSIYRFKNGVAEQFVALPRIYNPENNPQIARNSDYFHQMGKVEPLEENWRSSPEVVHFNNSFFEKLKTYLSPDAQLYYNSITQNAMSTLPGIVEIESVRIDAKDNDVIPFIVAKIKACEAEGFKRGEICILGDTNRQTNGWAVELTKVGYKIVSAESLLVHNELNVQLVVSYLKRRLNPSSKSEMKRFAELYFRIHQENSFTHYRSYFAKKTTESGKEIRVFDDEKFIASNFGTAEFYCKYENLYDLVQSFYRMLKWDELKNPYLHHFADFTHHFELAKGPDLKSFLDNYSEQRNKLAIQLPESEDAIQIMTIHKSKGLEFPVVILPSIDFSTKMNTRSKHLVEIDDKIIYTTTSKDSILSTLAQFNLSENAQILTDKVNQCYVAFTRPMERLYVSNRHTNNAFGEIVHACLEQFEGATYEGEKLVYKTGENYQHVSKEKTTKFGFFEPQANTENLWFPDISLQDRAEIMEKSHLSPEQRFGTQFHLAMSLINQEEEVVPILATLLKEGQIECDFKDALEQKIRGIFAVTEVQQLFENAIEIANEQSILMDEQTTLRPDKLVFKRNETIILDYKTGIPSKKDAQQMKNYIRAIQEIGYPNVKGYVFYTVTNELVAI